MTTPPTGQPTLFGDDPPAQRHSGTSREAAEQIAGVSGPLRRAVYEWLLGRGDQGGTDEEIQDALNMPASTQRPRRVELVETGFVRDSTRTRLTRSRRKAVVWVAVRQGTAGTNPAVQDRTEVTP